MNRSVDVTFTAGEFKPIHELGQAGRLPSMFGRYWVQWLIRKSAAALAREIAASGRWPMKDSIRLEEAGEKASIDLKEFEGPAGDVPWRCTYRVTLKAAEWNVIKPLEASLTHILGRRWLQCLIRHAASAVAEELLRIRKIVLPIAVRITAPGPAAPEQPVHARPVPNVTEADGDEEQHPVKTPAIAFLVKRQKAIVWMDYGGWRRQLIDALCESLRRDRRTGHGNPVHVLYGKAPDFEGAMAGG